MKDIAYPYIETVPEQYTPQVTVAEIKSYLKLNDYNVSINAELELMYQTALSYAEKYSRRLFEEKIVETERCFWGELRNGDFENVFTLRRSPVNEIVSITYDDEETLDENLYKLAKRQNQYGQIQLIGEMPELETDWFPIKITFKAGYKVMPKDVKIAILQHIASMWMNRGDADNDSYNKCPKISKDIYKKYKIMEVGA